MKLLIINPGSTSTKISVYEDFESLFEDSEFHDSPLLLQYPHVNDQVPFRNEVTLRLMARHGFTMDDIDVIVGRGGSAYTQISGVTVLDEQLYLDTLAGVGGSEHAAKLGVLMAWTLGHERGLPMYTMDPTNIDEFCDLARLTGIRGIYRANQAHSLNQKAVAKFHARAMGKKYEEVNLVVAHIDGGVTCHAHEKGRMIDGNIGAGGEGPFAPTRIGAVPVLPLLDYIDKHSTAEVRLMCSRAGGFVSLFGTSDAKKIHALREEGDPKATLVWDTMIYQVCKFIGAMSCAMSGQVDGIVLTGGLVRFPDVTEDIRRRCGWIAPVTAYPGEMEQDALAHSTVRALRGEEPLRHYTGKPVWSGFEGLDL